MHGCIAILTYRWTFSLVLGRFKKNRDVHGSKKDWTRCERVQVSRKSKPAGVNTSRRGAAGTLVSAAAGVPVNRLQDARVLNHEITYPRLNQWRWDWREDYRHSTKGWGSRSLSNRRRESNERGTRYCLGKKVIIEFPQPHNFHLVCRAYMFDFFNIAARRLFFGGDTFLIIATLNSVWANETFSCHASIHDAWVSL